MTVFASGGPPVLLLHGLGGSRDTLAPLAHALESRGFNVDHPTLAECDRRQALVGGDLSHLGLDVLLDEAREFGRSLVVGGRKPAICGHSNGALLALALAAEGRASHIVLLAPVPPPSLASSGPQLLQKLFFLVSFGPGWTHGVLHFDRKRRLDPDPPSSAVAKTLLPDSGRVLSNASGLVPGCSIDPEPPLDVPIMIFAGERDRIVRPETARRVATRYRAGFQLCRGAGHWFPADDRFAPPIAKLIANFLEDGPDDALADETT